MPSQPSAALKPSSPAERRSGVVFTTILLLVLLAVSFPEMAPQVLLGVMWSGVGVLMLGRPPEVRLPRLWPWLAAGFIGFSLVGFLPREWFQVPRWRLDLEALGLDTGRHVFEQPLLAAESLAGFAVTAVTALFLLGHRVDTRLQHRLVIGFALGVGVWTLAALYGRQPGALFGFFPNRNHTATLLTMAAFAGLGGFTQAIRLKDPWKIALSVVPTCLFLGVLLTVSESRAGVVLVVVGLVAWILLSGMSHLRGHAGKAIALLLLGIGGMFLISDSKVKTRLDDTVEQFEAPLTSAVAPKISFDVARDIQADPNMDGRIAIYHDTWTMIRRENPAGVGPGQFAQVFPQYREVTNADNNSIALHPESDWLMVLAENGWLATLCLAAVAAAVLLAALRQARTGRARFLRVGSLVAAGLLCLHGIFDVPGHRIGLLWAAILLAAMSLRSPQAKASDAPPGPSRACRFVWRCLGLLLLLAGAALLVTQWTNTPLLPSVRTRRLIEEAKALYDADQAAYDRATAEGRDYQPPPGQDPLETALERVEQAIRISPLAPHLHYIRGALALHFDDQPGVAAQAFAIQRRLVPTRVDLPLEQARAWMVQDPQQTKTLWSEALRRTAAEHVRFPHGPGIANTYQQVLHTAGKDETLVGAALEVASGKPVLVVAWAGAAPIALLDREMPRLLAAPELANDRITLFRVWKNRGSKAAAANFAKAHPELGLAPP